MASRSLTVLSVMLGLAIAAPANAESCPDQRRWPWSDRAAINGALRSEYGQLHASYGAMGCARRPAVMTGAEDYCAVLAERLAAIHRELQLNHWFGARVTACGPEGSRPPLALAPVEDDDAAAKPEAPARRGRATTARPVPREATPGLAQETAPEQTAPQRTSSQQTGAQRTSPQTQAQQAAPQQTSTHQTPPQAWPQRAAPRLQAHAAPEPRPTQSVPAKPEPVSGPTAKPRPVVQGPATPSPQPRKVAAPEAPQRAQARPPEMQAQAPVQPRIAPPNAAPAPRMNANQALYNAPAPREPSSPAPSPTATASLSYGPHAAPPPGGVSAGYLASIAEAGLYEVSETPVEPPGSPLRKRFMAKGGRFACVRTCDGFYFPLNQSVRGGDAQDMCTSLCPGARTEVFRTSASGSMADAVSMGGQRYGALRSAFLYRRSVNPGCGCKIPGQSWEALLRPAERVLASPHHDVILDENEADRLSRAQARAKLRAEAAQEAASAPAKPAAPPPAAGPARAAQRTRDARDLPDPTYTGTVRVPPRR
ncbi:DUF2865 domain-containing protein [Alsobacter sp. KACC 23698]|uniref:DUF2865 domain-containing protein n=1 Tax=Alsobacter sp. KACC 23698 TaxID=3149229 RepID=A0AAU7JBJ8_9HYPH